MVSQKINIVPIDTQPLITGKLLIKREIMINLSVKKLSLIHI